MAGSKTYSRNTAPEVSGQHECWHFTPSFAVEDRGGPVRSSYPGHMHTDHSCWKILAPGTNSRPRLSFYHSSTGPHCPVHRAFPRSLRMPTPASTDQCLMLSNRLSQSSIRYRLNQASYNGNHLFLIIAVKRQELFAERRTAYRCFRANAYRPCKQFRTDRSQNVILEVRKPRFSAGSSAEKIRS